MTKHKAEWTAEDDKQIADLYDAGYPFMEMSIKAQRSVHAIKSRLIKLRKRGMTRLNNRTAIDPTQKRRRIMKDEKSTNEQMQERWLNRCGPDFRFENDPRAEKESGFLHSYNKDHKFVCVVSASAFTVNDETL